jgi:hypothetical protein
MNLRRTKPGGYLWEAPEPFQLQNSGANVAGFWKSKSSLPSPDINIVQIELPYTSEVLAKQYAPPPTSWALCAGLVAPKSRGILRPKSANPADKPIVDAKFLTHPILPLWRRESRFAASSATQKR